jgi:outer membrane protein OmpA-like peptidoglycan-associated protein
MKHFALVVLLLISNTVAADNTRQRDVEEFKKNADLCEHLAGEWDSNLSKNRQKEIERGVLKHCGRAQQQLQRLRKKYKDDPAASAEIEGHANPSVMDFRK